ncbi:MAG: hypothetical protein AB7J32_15625 [Pseudonocardia sp.]
MTGGPPRRVHAAGIPRVVLTVLAALLALVACGTEPVAADGLANAPAPPEGPERIAAALLAPGADVTALLTQLRPEPPDYAEVFRLDIAKDARTHYEGYWQHPQLLGPAPGQTEVRVDAVTTEELIAGTGASAEFPSGYRTVAPQLNPGITIYQLVFHAPGSALGTRVDGLVYLQGRWRIFPAPWAVLEINEPGHQH